MYFALLSKSFLENLKLELFEKYSVLVECLDKFKSISYFIQLI